MSRCPTCNQPLPDANATGKRVDPPLPRIEGYDALEEIRQHNAKPSSGRFRTGW